MVGWSKAIELAKVARKGRQSFDCATWLHKARALPKEEFKREVDRHLTGKETEPWEILYFKALQEPVAGDRAGTRNSRPDARDGQIPRLLPGDDLCGFSGRGELGGRRPQSAASLPLNRLFKLLPAPQKQQFLESLEKAS